MLFPRFFPCRNDPSARRVFLPAKAPLVSQGELSATRMTEGIKPPVFHRTFFPAPAVSTTALPGRNQRETAHGFSLSLRVRVHRERGSRNTLSLCDSLHTFCSHRKYARRATGSESMQAALIYSHKKAPLVFQEELSAKLTEGIKPQSFIVLFPAARYCFPPTFRLYAPRRGARADWDCS